MAKQLRMLAPDDFREKLSRRAFLKGGTAAAGFAIVLAACGSSDDEAVTIETTGSDMADDGYSRVVNTASGTLAMYTWGDYNDPDLVGALADSTLGVSMKVDYYASNEDLITKLAASNGNSGFDIVVPTGPYVPQMIEKGLIQKLDLSLIPNFSNLDPAYTSQAWDPNNEYSVCKNWGSTGYFYDKTKITRTMETWQDFIDACMNEGSGNCAMIDTAPNFCGMWFWANGINWNTQDEADLDACEKFLVEEFAQHIKAFDSYPSTKLAEGAYSLAMGWNGDLRQAYVRIADAGGNPEDWVWVLGSPATELWMDTYCIAAGSPNAEAAHAWINWDLVPEISIKDLEYHGYNTGMKDMESLIANLAPDLERGEMIFFTPEQVATFQTQEITPALDRMVDILNKAKAKAGA
ncbi:MAG: extracellular solute-binding protein [Ilumatobacteraceae bacterium]|jgi:spermidine/putrescine transport system substrate-binding protein